MISRAKRPPIDPVVPIGWAVALAFCLASWTFVIWAVGEVIT